MDEPPSVSSRPQPASIERRAQRLPREHPQRVDLANEVHARPPEPLTPPERVSYVAVLVNRDERMRERAHLAHLCDRTGAAAPSSEANHFACQVGPLRVRWEGHAEFSSYAFYVHEIGSQAFDEPATTLLPDGWLASIPGQTIAAAHVMVMKHAVDCSYRPLIERWFSNAVVGAQIGDGAAFAFTDFRIGDDGCERFLLLDQDLTPRQAGRMSQRLFEIEAYRVMALLALPLARMEAPRAADAERALAVLTDQIAHRRQGDEALLASLTQLAAQIETAIDASQYRFSAAAAYYDLVRARIAELRERPLPGIQTIDEFMTRRLAPAMATCASVSRRLRELSERVAQASGLLSTRVEIAREEQNQKLLGSMERRARLQLRLQETVEGLSIAAITYYGAGLVGYLARGAHSAGLPVDHDVAVAVAIPLIALAVALALKRVRRAIGSE
jgi:uncharacterized membrane-anchored protein